MPKNTLAFLILLAVIASLLVGINIGKKLGVSQYISLNNPVPTAIISPYLPSPTIWKPTPENSDGSFLYSSPCGFEISYKGKVSEQLINDYVSSIFTDPAYPDNPIVTTCQEEIPKPPLIPERIEDINIDGVPAKLYHDASSKDGSPRDEVIVKHPTRNHEVIIAGFGPAFDEAVLSFKFTN